MKKSARLAEIKRLVETKAFSSQEELARSLEARGLEFTQATLSRDLRELNIAKIQGVYSFLTATPTSELMRVFESYVRAVNRVEFMVVANTRLGEADLLASALDRAHCDGVLATIAGADTVLVTCKDVPAAVKLYEEIQRAIH